MMSFPQLLYHEAMLKKSLYIYYNPLGQWFPRDFCSDPIIGLRVRPATHITLIFKKFSFLKKNAVKNIFIIYIKNVLQICWRPMQPIIVLLTHKKVCRDPILGCDPWFGNPGLRVVLLRKAGLGFVNFKIEGFHHVRSVD